METKTTLKPARRHRHSPLKGFALLFVSAVGMGLGASVCFAQDQPAPSTAPATNGDASAAQQQSTQPGFELLSGTVTAIKGTVRVRMHEEDKWQLASVGMVLPQGAEIHTGFRSAIQITIPPAQVLTLDRMTTVRLTELARSPDMVKSNIGMQYGRTQLNIEKSGVSHDAKVQTPSTTLALRGTDVTITDQVPFVPTAVSYTGRATAQFRGKPFPITFGTNRYTVINEENNNPAEQAQFSTGVNLRPDEGTTTTEQQMVSRYPMFNGTGGGVIGGVTAVNKSTSSPFTRSFDTSTGSNAGGLAYPMPNPTVASGQLQLSLLSPAGSNVNFTVVSPFNEFINQKFGSAKLGGTFTKTTTTSGDTQQVTWSSQYAEGGYILRAQRTGLTSATVPVTFQIKQDTTPVITIDRTLSNIRPTANIDVNIKKGTTPTH
jgi:hypothetical protein